MSGVAAKGPGGEGHDNFVLALIVAVVLFIGCLAVIGVNWPWTGFKGNETLWDWLSLLVTPLAIATLPVRIAVPDHMLVRYWRRAGAVLVVVTAILIVGGYGLGWTWTGFAGQELWDWLHLLLLPAVLVFLPDWYSKGAPISRVGGIVAVVLLAAFVLVIIGGYGEHWAWTGFEGNTFHDWLDLLIAPFLLPAACRWFQVRWTLQARPSAAAEAVIPAAADPVETAAPVAVEPAGTDPGEATPTAETAPSAQVTPGE
jgi:hypothetical protein